jgi:hypothetical protein
MMVILESKEELQTQRNKEELQTQRNKEDFNLSLMFLFLL